MRPVMPFMGVPRPFKSPLGAPRSRFACALAMFAAAAAAPIARAQTIEFFEVPAGYEAGSIDLPDSFGGALAADPHHHDVVYAAIGEYQHMSLARVDLTSGTVTVVADGPFGAISGIAPFSGRHIAVIDSDDAPGGPRGETILLLEDRDADGDFNGHDEIHQLIHPILADGGDFTGSQAHVVPKKNPKGIKSGSLMFQTADGDSRAELLSIKSPLKKPRYDLHGRPFFAGFDFNGGFDFDSLGRVVMGTVTGDTFEGKIYLISDVNGRHHVQAGHNEAAVLVSGEGGCSDLTIDHQDHVYFAGFDEDFFPAIRTFGLPHNATDHIASVSDFADLDAGFISAVVINTKDRSFAPDSGAGGATMVMSGFDAFFDPANNLLTLTPSAVSATPPSEEKSAEVEGAAPAAQAKSGIIFTAPEYLKR